MSGVAAEPDGATMTGSSRKGRKIARRACDLCRDRRVQCVPCKEATTDICQRCLAADLPCTFLKERRPRGPPSRWVTDAREKAALHAAGTSRRDPVSPQASSPSSIPSVPITISHLIPENAFSDLIGDFLQRVYPVLPLIHVPTFQDRLARRVHETDPSFLRLCLSLCAVTVASIPRSGKRYGYAGAAEFVDRAAQLVMLSRMATDPAWQSDLSIDNMLLSLIFSLAFHYTGRANPGWSYLSESLFTFRELELYKKDSYERYTSWDAEVCKRCFWILFFCQVHDRINFALPHTGLSYDPQHTDWEFLMPLELPDEALSRDSTLVNDTLGSVCIISGLVALIKVFLCVLDLLDRSFPGPPAYFSLWLLGGLPPISRLLNEARLGPSSPLTSLDAVPDSQELELLRLITARLDRVLSQLPEPLRLPPPDPDGSQSSRNTDQMTQFGIMRTNVHITAIYFQSHIMEMCISKISQSSTSASDAEGVLIRRQLWQMKESIAREVISIVSCSSPVVIESNGSSMIRKIREIAATLLDEPQNVEGSVDMHPSEQRRSEYIKQFVEILAKLDYMPQIEE